MLHFFVIAFILVMTTAQADAKDTCHLPRSVLSMKKSDFLKPPKFVEFSCTAKGGRCARFSKVGGIGNTLVSFPAVYLYAMVSGRHLILNDHSAMGAWCRALNCSFPFTSEVEKQFPEFKLKKIKRVNTLNGESMAAEMRGNISNQDVIVGFRSLNTQSAGWYMYGGQHTIECIRKLTGCHPKSGGCIERFAFQQLLRGGFNNDAIPSEVVGLLPHEVNSILREPYMSNTRFDAGIHIRAQTKTLENKVSKNHTQFALDMAGYHVVFREMERALSHRFFVEEPVRFNLTNASVTGRWPRIFISCDDVEVRNAFIASLLNRTVDIGLFHPVFVNTSDIKHVKHVAFNSISPDTGIVNTAFDWYALSLCQVAYAWRLRYSLVMSTFLLSATRVSMVKLTNKDFKATILHNNLKFRPAYEPVDEEI